MEFEIIMINKGLPIPKYHVFILGAGASAHAGMPLLSNFFERAEELCKGSLHSNQPPMIGYMEAINLLRDFRKKNATQCKHKNIEDVYKLASETQDEKTLDALNTILLGVLDLHGCIVKFNDQQYHPDEVYSSFVEKCFVEKPEDKVVINFNWDCLLDYALAYHDQNPDYGFNPQRNPKSLKLFKMHGSINWAFCKDCKKQPDIIRPQDFIGNRHIRRPLKFDLRLISEGLTRRKCTCGKPLSPKIIPPTHKKDLLELKLIWESTKEYLENAFCITVIGYSFPDTDVDFCKLVNTALERNIDLNSIQVVNPSNGDLDFQTHYKKSFGDHHKDKLFFSDKFSNFDRYVKNC